MLPICLWTGIKWGRKKRWMKLSTYPESIDWKSFYKTLKVSRPFRNLMLNMSQNHSYLPSPFSPFRPRLVIDFQFHFVSLVWHCLENYEAWERIVAAKAEILTFCFAKKTKKIGNEILCANNISKMKWRCDVMNRMHDFQVNQTLTLFFPLHKQHVQL